MGRSKWKWDEKAISRREKEGYGRGAGVDYKPWLTVDMVSSLGRSRRIWSPKLSRTVHLLSDVEHRLFLALEWQRDIADIREQFPLDRSVTQTIANDLGIRHPYYPGGHVLTVMTIDFLVVRVANGKEELCAFDAKRDEEAQDERSLGKLEIQREYMARMDAPHHLVYHSQIPRTLVDNLDWIRDADLKQGEIEPSPGLFAELKTRMARELETHLNKPTALSTYCQEFDTRYGKEPGTGLRVARMLMAERTLCPDLDALDIAAMPLNTFRVTARPGALRVVGG